MTTECFESLYHLRSSELKHHASRDVEEIMMRYFMSESSMDDILQYFEGIEGTGNVLSDDGLATIKYSIIGSAYYLTYFMVLRGVSAEYAHGVSDYFCRKVDLLQTVQEGWQLFSEMFGAYKWLFKNRRSMLYGKPIDTCISYIEQNLYAKLTARDIADALHYSPEHLSRLFKQETGKKLYQYITERKIEEAKEILKLEKVSVTMMASSLGFSSTQHFSMAFKKATGITPMAYRKTYYT